MNQWLKTMFFMPYELLYEFGKSYKERNFNMFLKKKHSAKKNLSKLNMDNNNKTIFEIRYHKFNEIIKYRNRDVILVNLSYLQNSDNANIFLRALQEKYMKPMKENKLYKLTFLHTKSKKNEKNIKRENVMEDEDEKYIKRTKNI